ncbi:uncharacterized protein LOC115921268 [Strongylocentrotus purpuratus]|uniref:Uncharacterized protein n=1 Tax=Strongylocentrotus purpuratus TaxID=7668 RepID=A0A7M7NCU4_STRPU|nr:uncharacterized protein LOC115921268 [Strongylocentrotus purpuratus]
MHRREGGKSGQDTVLRGDARLKVHVVEWMSTDDETHLELRDMQVVNLSDLISILASLCPAVKHFSINSIRVYVSVSLITPVPKLDMPMKSILTLCIKSVDCDGKLQETLLEINKCFPKAESLDLQVMNLNLSSKEYISGVNSSSSLRELKLRWTDRVSDDVTTADSLFMDISTSCPHIVSLVLSGFGRFLLNKSGIDIKSYKLPHLTNIHLEVIGTDDCCRFAALTNVLHVVHVTSPRLKLVEAEKVHLGGAELASVKWSQTSSGCELQLEGASAAVPMADLMHLVSNELEGLTVLTFDRCKVDFPQLISHPQGTGEESSLQELKFLNVENPLSQTDIHKLSEIYPNTKVTVAHDSKASHEDSNQGTSMPLIGEVNGYLVGLFLECGP